MAHWHSTPNAMQSSCRPPPRTPVCQRPLRVCSERRFLPRPRARAGTGAARTGAPEVPRAGKARAQRRPTCGAPAGRQARTAVAARVGQVPCVNGFGCVRGAPPGPVGRESVALQKRLARAAPHGTEAADSARAYPPPARARPVHRVTLRVSGAVLPPLVSPKRPPPTTGGGHGLDRRSQRRKSVRNRHFSQNTLEKTLDLTVRVRSRLSAARFGVVAAPCVLLSQHDRVEFCGIPLTCRPLSGAPPGRWQCALPARS